MDRGMPGDGIALISRPGPATLGARASDAAAGAFEALVRAHKHRIYSYLCRLTNDSPDAEDMARRLATEEGIFGGVSAGGACAVALRIAREVENATIVFVVCDRGDRYLSTGVFPG